MGSEAARVRIAASNQMPCDPSRPSSVPSGSSGPLHRAFLPLLTTCRAGVVAVNDAVLGGWPVRKVHPTPGQVAHTGQNPFSRIGPVC